MAVGVAAAGLLCLMYSMLESPAANSSEDMKGQARVQVTMPPARMASPRIEVDAKLPSGGNVAVVREDAPHPAVLDSRRLQKQIDQLLQVESLIRLNAYVEAVDCQAGRCAADLAVPATSAEARSKGAAAVADIMDHMKKGLREAGLTLAIRSIGQSDQGLKARFEVSPQEAEQSYVLTAEQISQMRMETLKQAERGK